MSNKTDVTPGVEALNHKPADFLRVQPSVVYTSSILPDGVTRSRTRANLIHVDKDGDAYSSGFESAPPSSDASQAGEESDSGGSVHSRKSVDSAPDEDASNLQDTLNVMAKSLQSLVSGHRQLRAAQEEQEMKLAEVISGRIEARKEPQDISNIVNHGLEPTPPVARLEERKNTMARQLESSNLPPETQAIITQAMGLTSAKVNPSPPLTAQPFSFLHAPGTGGPDVFNAVKALNAAYLGPFDWTRELGQQVVNEQAIRKTKEAKNKQFLQALGSADKLYEFLYQQGMFSGQHFETYDTLYHQVKQLELRSGWGVARRYVEYLIDIDNKYKDTRPLQGKVGPRPVDGNFFNTLDPVGLRLCQHEHAHGQDSKVEALEKSLAEVMAKLKLKGKDYKKQFTPAGSPTKEGKNQYYCKHHKLYFSNPEHTSEKCRLGKRSPNAGPAPNAAGAGSD